jgi:hypothetical protein
VVLAAVVAGSANEIWGCLWWDLAEFALGGRLDSDFRFCVGAFGRNLASAAVKVFPHLICFIKTFYEFCTFNVLCKVNAAVNYITVQKKIPVTLMGHTASANVIIDVVVRKQGASVRRPYLARGMIIKLKTMACEQVKI